MANPNTAWRYTSTWKPVKSVTANGDFDADDKVAELRLEFPKPLFAVRKTSRAWRDRYTGKHGRTYTVTVYQLPVKE